MSSYINKDKKFKTAHTSLVSTFTENFSFRYSEGERYYGIVKRIWDLILVRFHSIPVVISVSKPFTAHRYKTGIFLLSLDLKNEAMTLVDTMH